MEKKRGLKIDWILLKLLFALLFSFLQKLTFNEMMMMMRCYNVCAKQSDTQLVESIFVPFHIIFDI